MVCYVKIDELMEFQNLALRRGFDRFEKRS